MFDIRVRLVKDNGTTDATSRVLDVQTATYSSVLNGEGSLTFTVSRDSFVPVTLPFLVRVEHTSDGGNTYAPLPENEMFIVEDDSDDSLDPGKIVTYNAVPFVPWLLAGAYVGTGPWEKDGERTINGDGAGNSNAGQIMAYFIDESKGRGWLPALQRSFNASTDTAGVAWTVADRQKIGWRLETFYPQVLEQMSEQGMCDWVARGRALDMFRPNTKGRSRLNLVVGGPEFSRVPVKSDVSSLYTHVIAVSDAGRVHVQNTAAEARFGRRSISMSQTGVKDVATSTKLANTLLADGQKPKREEAYEWTPQKGGLFPFRDFLLGDMITAKSRGGKLPRRVIGVIVNKDQSSTSAQIRVGEKITTSGAKAGKVLSSVSVGGVIGGSGGAFPTSPPMPSTKPLAPDALRIVSNNANWGTDGIPHTAVELDWDVVTEGEDGSEVDITMYEIWSRMPDGELSFDAAVVGIHNSVTVGSWAAGIQRLVAVRAQSNRGVWSDFSLEVPVTPASAAELTPKPPMNLGITSNVGTWTTAGPMASITLTWDAVTETTSAEPVVISEYEVRQNGVPIQAASSAVASVSIPSSSTVTIRVRARSVSGAWGDLSDPINVTGAAPGAVVITPTKPTLKTGFGSVIAEWDGAFVVNPTNAALGVQAKYESDTDVWVPFGVVMTERGSSAIAGVVGETLKVRFDAVDRAGRVSGSSATETVVVEAINGEDIMANTISGNKVISGTIEVDRLSPNVGEDLNISANGSIVFMAGRQDESERAIENVQDGLNTAINDIGTAQAQADIAAGAALVALNTANDADAKATELGTVLRLTEDGLILGRPSGVNELRLTPEAVEIAQNGVAVSRWEAGRMIVNEMVVNRALIGSHTFENYSEGRTVVRPTTTGE